ncbi:MAG: LysR family transcriptional regulator [Yoonia sp.]
MIGNILNLKQLEALVWTAELRSFRKAADHLNTTQPNISARIAGLEKTLGIVLMQRSAGSVQLTEVGEDILRTARDVLATTEQIVAIAQRQDLISDRLRLGVTELVACTWLHAFLRRIKSRYPALNVELTVDLSRNLDAGLTGHQLDLAVQTAPFNSVAAGNVALGVYPYVWVASPRIASELTGQQGIANLLPHGILTHARHTQAYVELSAHMRSSGLPTTRIASSNSMASCVQMAADGMGVSLLPKALVANALAVQDLIEIDLDWTPSALQFAARYPGEKSAGHIADIAQLAAEAAAEHLSDHSA